MRVIAYLDANTGSMIVGVVAAGAAGVGVAFRSGLSRLRRKGRDADDAVEDPGAEETTETIEPAEADDAAG